MSKRSRMAEKFAICVENFQHENKLTDSEMHYFLSMEAQSIVGMYLHLPPTKK